MFFYFLPFSELVMYPINIDMYSVFLRKAYMNAFLLIDIHTQVCVHVCVKHILVRSGASLWWSILTIW